MKLLFLVAASACLYANISIKHREPKGIGYETGFTTLEVFFAPSWNRSITPFLDGRIHILNSGHFASNVGVGTRYAAYDKWSLGANAYYDFRDAKKLHPSQFGCGLESLSPYFDVRLNGYLPVGDVRHAGKRRVDGFKGNYCQLKRDVVFALPKVEGEIGKSLVKDLYLALGGYHLFKQSSSYGNSDGSWGGMGRLFARYHNIIEVELFASCDRIFSTRLQAMISLSFRRKNREKRVFRSEIIPIQRKTKRYPHPQKIIFCDNTFGSKGTWEDPYGYLEEAIVHATKKDIIYFLPGDGTSHKNESGVVIPEGYTVVGGSEPLNLGDIVVSPLTPGRPPKISANRRGSALTLGEGAAVSGIAVEGGRVGVLADAASYSLENVTISNVQYGIYSSSPEEGTRIFTDITVNNAKYGAYFKDGGGEILLRNCSFTDCLKGGVIAQSSKAALTIEKSHISTRRDGVRISDGATLKDVTIDGGRIAILADANANSYKVENVAISNAKYGIYSTSLSTSLDEQLPPEASDHEDHFSMQQEEVPTAGSRTLSHVSVSNSQYGAFFNREKGEITMKECSFIDCKKGGVASLPGGGNLVIEGCFITSNKFGVWIPNGLRNTTTDHALVKNTISAPRGIDVRSKHNSLNLFFDENKVDRIRLFKNKKGDGKIKTTIINNKVERIITFDNRSRKEDVIEVYAESPEALEAENHDSKCEIPNKPITFLK